MSKLKIYNTLTSQKEEFIPLNPPEVKMYVCGITPYDETHMGHARCYVIFDMARRYMAYSGFKVKYAQNFTDIDDKIIKRAQELGIEPAALAEKYENEFLQSCAALNILPADSYPKVTQNIPAIIALIEGIIKNGFAYAAGGDVYYSVRKTEGYGKLSGRNIDELIVGARVEPGENKKDPLDFALWKAAKPGEPSWDSPWGKGRPGWHIECSAMSLKELKTETLDIHGGGQDLVFPHHENEIAQAEAFSGKKLAKYWMHNGFVTINKEKMSKSLGNFFTLRVALEKYDAMVIRYFLLSQHYRGALDFSESHLEQAGSAWGKISDSREKAVEFLEKHSGNKAAGSLAGAQSGAAEFKNQFETAMNDDFNTSGAFAALHSALSEINKIINAGADKNSVEKNTGELKEFLDIFDGMCAVLGFRFSGEKEIPQEIKELLAKRDSARKSKNWAESDSIRAQLISKGFSVDDTPEGQRAKKLERN